MKKNKFYHLVGTLSLLTPSLFLVSCSTTWTSWKTENTENSKATFKHDLAPKPLWSIRSKDELLNAAYNSNTQTLDLMKVNNQFEFLRALGYVLQLIPSGKNIDEFWNDYDGLGEYISNIPRILNFSISYLNENQTYSWNVEQIKDGIKKSLKEYSKRPAIITGDQIDSRKYTKYFDIEANGGLDETGKPVEFAAVAEKGIKLTTIPIVSELLKIDSDFALLLSKLVNLPFDTFRQFSALLKILDNLLDEILVSVPIDNWLTTKNPDLSIGFTGKRDSFLVSEDLDVKKSLLKGLFLVLNLKA